MKNKSSKKRLVQRVPDQSEGSTTTVLSRRSKPSRDREEAVAYANELTATSHYALKWSFEPSVAQPPLPLQSFLALQPLALDLHPPWPLQSFLPLQECLSPSSIAAFAIETFPAAAFMTLALAVIPEWDAGVGAACNLAVVPPKRPDTAAVIIIFLIEFFIKLSFRKTDSRAAELACPGRLCYLVRIVFNKVTAII